MPTFVPFLADSLEGFYKDFLSFLVNKGVQAHRRTKGGIKGIKGGKYLSHLFSLYSCLAYGWRVCIHLTTLQRVLPIDHQHGAKRARFLGSGWVLVVLTVRLTFLSSIAGRLVDACLVRSLNRSTVAEQACRVRAVAHGSRVLPGASSHGAKRPHKFASFLVCQGVSKRPYSIQLNRESNHDH